MPFPLAVVIPTYNRRDALQVCLQHLEEQVRTDFEVVIVDDGSTDGTSDWVGEFKKRTRLAIRYIRQQNGGPARARNVAVAATEAPVVLLIGDDIFPSPTFTAIHMQLHEERPGESVVGLGLTVWDTERQKVTRFMRWLDRDGLQFHYGELLAGEPPTWKHFYTSNLSLKTSLLRAYPFDESFPSAAMEDIEVACRIDVEHGLEMVFLPNAVASHLHPMTLRNALRRMDKVGESSGYFDTLWPGKLPRGKQSRIFHLGCALAGIPFVMPALEWVAAQSVRFACPNRAMTFALNYHFNKGYSRFIRKAEQPKR